MVTIVDGIMGSGKSTLMTHELNSEANEYKSYLWVTPYLEEIKRVQENTYRDVQTPHNWGCPKSTDVKRLLKGQNDIGITHELFKSFDNECKELVRGKGYTLIIDEAIEAVKPAEDFTEGDFNFLSEHNAIQVDSSGALEWVGYKPDVAFKYTKVSTLIHNKCLFKVNKKFFVWTFPHDIFNLFDDVYVLTYRFEGSILQAFFKLYKIDYEVKSISPNGDSLVDYYEPNKERYRARFDLYGGGKYDDKYFAKRTALSKTWSTQSYNAEKLAYLKNSMQNYIRNILDEKSCNIMWTTYEKIKTKLSKKGYARGFVACNLRGVNTYRDKTVLMYCINWFEHPAIVAFFSQNGITVDEDSIALSMLLQWIWRCNIRMSESDKKIHLYIPSKRMRTLFIDWLNS